MKKILNFFKTILIIAITLVVIGLIAKIVFSSDKMHTKVVIYKAEKLLEDEISNRKMQKDSYTVISTEVRDAFTPWDDPSNIKTLKKLAELEDDYNKSVAIVEQAEEEMKKNEQGENILNKSKYIISKNEYKIKVKDRDKRKAKLDQQIAIMDSISNVEPQNIGYFICHQYKQTNKSGSDILDTSYFLVNDKVSRVKHTYEKEEIKLLQQYTNLNTDNNKN